MKKIFTLFMFVIATVMAVQAQGVKVTVTIDDPSHAGEVVFDGKNYEFDADGKLEFVADKGENLYINTKEPYSFAKGCTYTYLSTGEGQEPQTYDIWGLEYKTYGQVWISSPEYCVYYEINLTTINLAEARNKTLTVNVEGNASKVVLQSNANSEHFPLQEGANTVKFMDLDCPFQIRSDDYSKPIYEVYQNGDKVADSYGYWNITAEDGDILDIKADFPDKEVTITVNYEGDASPATISQFSVDNVPVEDKSKPVVAKMGQSLYFVADDSYYNIDYLRINGEDCPYGNYNGTIYGDVTIDVKQTLKPAWSAEVTVDVPERIEYNEHYSRPNIIPETSPFTVSIPEDMASYNYLVFKTSNSDYAIVSLTLDGEEIEKNSYTGEYQVYLKKDGQKINITTKEIERDKLFSFYFDSPEKANDTFVELYGFSLSCAEPSRKFEDIHAGYNVINFDEVDNAFKFYVYGPIETAVVPQVHAYLNNEPNYIVDNSHWQNNFNDGDVFKVYICPEAPATSTVEFTVQGEGAVDAATVDLINEFEVVDGLKMENILPGTEFTIALNPDFTITVNGDELEDPQNYYKFTVSEDTKVVISSTTGIETVVVESENNAVYNLLGVKVGESATNGLPAGLYIQNGKKLLVK